VTRTGEREHQRTVIQAGGVEIGGDEFVVKAGPCAVESEGQLLETAEAVAAAGARILRGSAYKPRSSPYTFDCGWFSRRGWGG
jgi:3-deoxy-7-phosphoheptulonate synthase